MKRINVTLAIAILFFGISCKKESSISTLGSWKLGSTSHKVVFSTKTTLSGGGGGTLFIFADATLTGGTTTANMLNISFPVAPTTSGTYQLVAGGTSTANNHMEVAAGSPANGAYAYIDLTPVNVNVTIANGKISISLPEITVKSTTGLPDLTLSGSVTEM